jgi:ABC-type sugar transport system ATPase subunit
MRAATPKIAMEKSYDEVKFLLKMLHREEVPVFYGSEGYLPDENTPVESPAADFMATLANDYSPEHPLYILAIGSIPNVASAILKNPKILILDEATAAMDTATERRIQEALTQLIKGKTTIMIAHRLSTLRDADELVVIERGKVAERGTHHELLQKEDGVYKKLFTLQEEALKSAGISE